MPYADPVVHYDIARTTVGGIVADFNTALVAGGWASTADVTAIAVYDSQNSAQTNGQTITINTTTFTFMSTATGSLGVQIGTSSAATIANLVTAINTVLAGTATAVAGTATSTMKVTWVAGGTAGNAIPIAEVSNGIWLSPYVTSGTSGFLRGGGYTLVSDYYSTMPGMKMKVITSTISSGAVQLIIGSMDDTLYMATGLLLGTNTTAHGRIIAWPNGFATYEPLVSRNTGFTQFVSMIAVPDSALPSAVSNVTNNAGLFQITTTGTHGLTTGDAVKTAGILLSGVTDLSVVNGAFTATVLTSTSITLDSSTYTGAYSSGGALAGPNQVAQCWFVQGEDSIAGDLDDGTFRDNVTGYGGNSGPRQLVCCSGNNLWEGGNTNLEGTPYFVYPTADLLWFDGRDIGSEPLVRFHPTNGDVDGVVWGEAINCLIKNVNTVASDFDADEPFATADGKFWWRYTNGRASGAAAGCLCIRVPATAGTPPVATITVI